MLNGERRFLVLKVADFQIGGEAVFLGEGQAVAQVFGFVLELGLCVVEGRIAQLEAGLTTEHLALVTGAEVQVVGLDVDVVVVDGQQVGVGLDAAAVFERVLVLKALGTNEHTGQVQGAAADLDLIGRVEGIVRPAADVGLDFGIVQGAARLAETLAELVLGVATVLDAGTDEQAARADLAAVHGPEGGADFIIREQQGTGADIAAIQGERVAQHDVDGPGQGVTRAVGRGGTDDLDTVDQFSRNTVDEEGPVGLAAGHPLAVDQDLGVTRVQAPHADAIGLEDVRKEGHAGHPLQGVTHGQGLEALEELQVIGQGRDHVVRTVTHHRLTGDDHLVQRRDGALRVLG